MESRECKRTSMVFMIAFLCGLGVYPAIMGPVNHERIAFSSDRNGNFEIYVMDTDGSNQLNITNNPRFDAGPSWAPDGKEIAFSSRRDRTWEIYIMDDNGDNQLRITALDASGLMATWAPDGKKIAFSLDDGTDSNICTMNIHKILFSRYFGHVRNLTSDPYFDEAPAWAPDGKRIAFDSNRDGNWEIYIMDTEGNNLERLTDDSFANFRPAWSPDGKKIAFESIRNKNFDIYVMDADGSNLKKLTDDPGDDRAPAWSPDGKEIVFESNRDGNWEIYVMNADGSNQLNLSNNPHTDKWPSWGCTVEDDLSSTYMTGAAILLFIALSLIIIFFRHKKDSLSE